jgi:WD40 repeat protein
MATTAVSTPPAASGQEGGAVYVGPRPFQTGERLFGRGRETTALISLLVAERVVLMYSPSGAGKTSLIQAGLVPELRPQDEAGARVLPRARSFCVPGEENRTDRNAPAVVIRVHTPLPPELTAAGVANQPNRYVLSALGSLEKHRPVKDRRTPAELAEMTLAEYIAAEFPTRFARADGKKGEEFRPTVLIVDQFEEVLTADPTDTEAKRAYFAQLGDVLEDRERWVLIAIREDHLAALDPFLSFLPNRLEARYRLDRLGKKAALDAIVGPADRAVGAGDEERGVGFDLSAAAQLVEDLQRVRVQQPDNTFATRTGPYVEPVHLQVVCKSLWEMKENRTRATPVTAADIAGLGMRDDLPTGPADRDLIGVDWVLAEYYATKVAEAAERAKLRERQVRDWFEKRLITVTRSRRPLPRGEETEFGITRAGLEVLDHAFLIREDARGGTYWLELAHDRLIEPVLRDNARWRRDKLHPFQRDAVLWAESGREGALLGGPALKSAEEWAAAHTDLLSPDDDDFLDKSRERQDEADRAEADRVAAQKAQARSRYTGIGIGALVGLVAVVIVLFVTGRRAGEQEARRAQQQRDFQARLWFEQQQQDYKRQLEAQRSRAENLERKLRAVLAAEKESQSKVTGPDLARQALMVFSEAETRFLGRGIISKEAEGLLRRTLQQVHGRQGVIHFDGPIQVIKFSPSGNSVVVGAETGSSRAYDLRKGPLGRNVGELLGFGTGITAAAFTPAEDYVIWGDTNGRVFAEKLGAPYGPNLTRYLRHFPSHSAAVRSIRVSNAWTGADGGDGWIVSVGSDGAGYLFRWKSGPAPIPIDKIDKIPQRGAASPGPATKPPLDERPISVTSVEFTPLPKKLFAGTTDGHIYAWDLDHTTPVATLVRRAVTDTAITALAIHPKALYLAVGTFRPKLRLWPMDPSTKEVSESVTDQPLEVLDTPMVGSLLFHPSGQWLAAVSHDQVVKLFQNRPSPNRPPAYEPVKLGPDRREWLLGPEATGRVTVVTFDSPGQGSAGRARDLFLAGYPDGTARLWDLSRAGQAPFVLPGKRSAVTAVAIHPGQTSALVGYQDGTVTTWDIKSVLGGAEAEPCVILGPTAPVTQLSLSPGGRRFVATDRDGGVVRGSLDPAGGSVDRVSWKGNLTAFPEGPSVVVLGPSPSRAPPAAPDGPALTLARWAAPDTLTPIEPIPVPTEPLAFALSPDRSMAAFLNPEGTAVTLVKLRPAPTVVGRIAVPPTPIQADTKQEAGTIPPDGAVALSADGRVLACAVGPRAFVWRFDPATGQTESPRHLPKGSYEGNLRVLAVSPDGRRVAVGDDRGNVRVWAKWDDEALRTHSRYRHRKAVTALAFTEDGNRVASGSEDTTASVWDLRTGADLVLSGHTGAIRALAIAPARDAIGTRLVTAGDDGTVRAWTLDRKALMKRAEAILKIRPDDLPPQK